MPNDLDIQQLVDLRSAHVPWDSLFLDPHNPRLTRVIRGETPPRVPDRDIPGASLQSQVLERLRTEIGFDEVEEKIKKVGFLTIDRIVVRQLADVEPPGYVVLEGNRRLASIKSIRGSEAVYRSLPEQVQQTLETINVLVYTGDDEDISWVLQGLRHMGGVKQWGPFQQARFLVELRERRDLSPTDLAQIAGIGRNDVAKLVRSYYGFMQATHDEDYGDLIDERDFAMFREATFHQRESAIWKWLEWNERDYRFDNESRLTTLLGQVKVPDEETGVPRIRRVNPDLRDDFSRLLRQEGHHELEEFLSGRATLQQAVSRLTHEEQEGQDREERVDLGRRLQTLIAMEEDVQTLPLPKILEQERSDEFVDLLQKVERACAQQTAFLNREPNAEEG